MIQFDNKKTDTTKWWLRLFEATSLDHCARIGGIGETIYDQLLTLSQADGIEGQENHVTMLP